MIKGDLQLIFSLSIIYVAAIGDFLHGLEASGLHDLSRVTSVASFFVSRVETLVDKMLEKIGTPDALKRQGKVSTIPDQGLQAFVDHGTVGRTIDRG
ncbi:putative transaldolase [Helianthus annuus]|uniref:Transaldolase n=1 Tax=Helianthus annuus TaxID=4232 RepID=A0A9K3DKS9_HELAN|nr:putative transaldolase [Helianthus annuus]KAJ0639088.1 putative transaldolase [Helianthus annuus]